MIRIFDVLETGFSFAIGLQRQRLVNLNHRLVAFSWRDLHTSLAKPCMFKDQFLAKEALYRKMDT